MDRFWGQKLNLLIKNGFKCKIQDLVFQKARDLQNYIFLYQIWIIDQVHFPPFYYLYLYIRFIIYTYFVHFDFFFLIYLSLKKKKTKIMYILKYFVSLPSIYPKLSRIDILLCPYYIVSISHIHITASWVACDSYSIKQNKYVMGFKF